MDPVLMALPADGTVCDPGPFDWKRIDRIEIPEELKERIADFTSEQRTLEDVIAWCYSQGPQHEVVGVVQQDEFSIDVIVRWTPKTGVPFHIVYDST